ncbi:MAG: uridine kinase family protein [Verrucomicrobiia bacterium]
MMRRLVAIVGGSGAGKSYLADRIVKRLSYSESIILRLDDFYKDLSSMPKAERGFVNFDEPDAIDWEEFIAVVNRIMNSSEPVGIPEYDFKTHTRLPYKRLFIPTPLTIIEGLWLIHRADLRSLFCYSIYVDCPEETRLQRRIERDVKERGRSEESVVRQFKQTVSPMHNIFIEPQKSYASKVITSPFAQSDIEEVIKTIKGLVR